MGKICEVGEKGLFLPLFGDGEQEWPTVLRVILYGLGLAWLFMGVALVADIFMGAIEKITSKRARKYNPRDNRWHTVEVWNPTVANLTLMALGSSAPEILLSVIELFSNEFYSGELGPSTIVGSAAFNLLGITAVCIVSIPDGEFRMIKEMSVFIVTAFFSVFAYLWLLIILLASSENVVEPWEGIFTFLFFPLLVILAFLADRGYLTNNRLGEIIKPRVMLSEDISKEELAELDIAIRQKYGPDLTPEQVTKIAMIENTAPKSRAQYRCEACRTLSGGKKASTADRLTVLMKKFTGELGEKVRNMHMRRNSLDGASKVYPEAGQETVTPTAVIEFTTPKYAILENAGSVQVSVERSGDMSLNCAVNFRTREGLAKAVEDFIHKEGTLEFGPGESTKTIDITIVDNDIHEIDEDFFIDLHDPKIVIGNPEDLAVLGEDSVATILIIDDDLPGVLSFPKDELHVQEQINDVEVEVEVERKHGCTGRIECKYATESNGALAGQDFDPLEGTLVFEPHQKLAKITVKIMARGRYERSEDFRIILTEPTGGAKFDEKTDGGADSNILTVFIETDQAAKDRVDRLMSALSVNWDRAKIGHHNWAEQFRAALFLNSGAEDDDEGSPGVMDYVMHVVNLPWKLLFAVVPPTDYCNGWVCFFSSLVMIGLVTALINDMASLLGCVMTLGNEVTAITFVAIGTSLPDTFASMTAAKQDPYADASIGNVTGSNSVNVFLGLGLPWMIASIYWRSGAPDAKWVAQYALDPQVPAAFRDGAFVVKAGSLAFSVGIFCGCAITCLVFLYVRRRTCSGELGGPTKAKYASAVFCASLWIFYIGLSSWKSLSESS